MILFPWVVSQFDLPANPMLIKRSRSLPPLDTSLEVVDIAEPTASGHIIVDGGTDLSLDVHRPEDARSKINKLMDRINMVTSDQAELQKQLAAAEDFHSQVLGPQKTVIAGTLERNLTTNTSVAGGTDFGSGAPAEVGELVRFARASNYVKAVSPKEIQCITLTPITGCSKRRVKGKASKSSLTESSGTGSGKRSNGLLTPVAETSQVTEIQEPSGGPPISDFREAVDTAMGSPGDETLPTLVAKSKISKQITPGRLSPAPSSPRPPSPHSRPSCTESRTNSYSSSIQNAPSTLSDRSGRMRIRTSSGGADDLRPSSSMSRIVPRPIHTSGSMTSQNSHGLKPFMTWSSDSGKRSDVDDASSLRSERLLHRTKTRDEKERSFEELIQSGGTIVCTLTPNEIRGIEVYSDSHSREIS